MMDQEYLKQLSDSLMIGAPRITPVEPNGDYLSNLSSYLRTGLKPEPRVINPVPTDYGIPETQLKSEITDLKAKGHTLFDVQSAIDSSSEITLKDQAKKLAKDLFGQQFLTSETPVIKLTKDVPATDIYGNKVKIPEGEALTPYELKGNKILLQDGETYVVSKNQFENIKGQAVSKEAKPFAPELAGTEESIRGEFTSVKEIEKYAKETDL